MAINISICKILEAKTKGLLSLSKFSLTKKTWSKFLKDFRQWQWSKKTLKDFDGIESHPIFLGLWWELELSFGMMQVCLTNKKHMVKTAGKAEFAGWLPKLKKVWTNDVIEELIEMVEARSVILNIKSKDYCDRDKRTSILSAFFRLLCDV